MSVTFAKELVEIIEYKVNETIRQGKKKAYSQVKQNNNKQSRAIRGILYKMLPTEEEYVERREKGNRYGGIKIIQGFIGQTNDDMKQLYREIDTGKRIDYSVFENENGMVITTVELKGFSGQKFFKKYISSGNLFNDMFKAEYQSKMFVLETTRKIFNENNIC